MNRDFTTHGLWQASAPPPPATFPLASDVEADVVIIGGGYTGCSAALRLAEGGLSAIVLDAVDVGFGGAGRNVGLVNAGLWVMPDALPQKLGPIHGERLLRQLGESPALVFAICQRYEIDCQVVRSGTLHCAADLKGLADISERARQWKSRGADVEMLDAGATSEIVGTKAYTGALLDRRAGTIQPLSYARGLAGAAMRAGAVIHSRSRAITREKVGDRWRVRTELGSVTAPWVMITTDAYSEGVSSDIRREQVMLPYFNMATSPLSADMRASILPARQGCWDTRRILSSFRFDSEGRLIFGSVGALRGTGSAIHRRWSERALARLFPQLGKVNFEYSWYGLIGTTDDGVPRLHLHDHNCISISGFNGRGIAPGTTFGRDLAEVVLGLRSVDTLSLPLTTLIHARFRSARTAFYEVGAQAAHFVGSRKAPNRN